MKDAAALAVEEINAQGGVLGRPIKVVYADTRGMPAEGRTAAERLVQEDKVVAVFGEFHSPVALAEIEVFHKYGVPFMACDVWSDKITAKGYPEVFRNSTAVSLIDTIIGDWLVAAGFKNIAMLTEKDDIGLDSRKAVAAVLDKAKVRYDTAEAEPTLTDFTAQLLRFKSHSPAYDMFFSEFAEAGAYDMIRQSHDLGFAPTAKTAIYNSGGAAVDPTFWQNAGQSGVHLCTENVGLPKSGWNDKTKALREDVHGPLQVVPARLGDGELRRRLAARRGDQDVGRHRGEGHHPRAGNHQLGRHTREVFLLHRSRSGLALPPVHGRAADHHPVRHIQAVGRRRAGAVAAEIRHRAVHLQEAGLSGRAARALFLRRGRSGRGGRRI